ncbi:MAG: outer membrane protein assembly factor BamA [Candidatus Omnitrophica bacterium]|nr:outer membrane protein assembly factor BamA [Candidatus Omnitrophota bacterium]
MKKTYLIPLTVLVFVSSFAGSNLLWAQEATNDQAAVEEQKKMEAVDQALSSVSKPEEANAQVADAASSTDVPAYSADEVASGKLVTSIDIQGNKSIGIATILTKIKTRVGQEYRQNVISDDLKRLYNTGYFSDVRVDRKEEGEGLKVIIFVEEKSIVDVVTFSKIKYFNKRVLLSKIKTQVGKFLDKKVLHDDVSTIEEMYQKKGLSDVKVDVESVVDATTNKASLHFLIREGFRVKVHKISVLGNIAYGDGKIIKVMKSRSNWVFNSGFLKEDVLTEDMDRVQAFYEKNGYIDATSTYEIVQRKQGLVDVNVTVVEGKRYYVGDIQVKGSAVISEPEVLLAMKDIKRGKIFSKQKLADDVANIKSLYFDKGYIFAKVSESTSLNNENGQVDLKLDVEEGGIAYVNKIKIQGNTQTRDIVVRRELRMYPGDQFDGVKMRRSKERLNNLGYFEEVGFDIQDTGDPQQKDLVVDVKEAKTGSFSFGGGYSTVDQLIGFVELEQRNFDFANWPSLTGGGQQVSARAEVGSSRNNMVLSFTEPWVFDYPVSGGFDLYRTQYLRESSTGYAYDQTRVGTKLRAGKEITEYLSAAGYYRIENVKIGNMESSVSADLRDEAGTSTLSVLGGSLTKDKRDSKISPTRGWILTGSTDVAGGPVGGDRDFYRLETSGAYYVPFRYNSVLEFNGRLGMVDAYGNAKKVPIFERYFAGGARSIRGYDERAIGPTDSVTGDAIGGEGIVTATVEYTIPLIDVIKFATFFDTGNVTAKYADAVSQKFYSGYGIGFRVKTPIGPMNLDYGIPLNKEPGETSRKSGKFYFSVSRGF